MERILSGYKVVYRTEKGDRSAVIGDSFGGVYYSEGRETVPRENCGPLAVFTTLTRARRFCEEFAFSTGDHHIHECEYIPDEESDMMWTMYMSTDTFINRNDSEDLAIAVTLGKEVR